MPSLRQERNDLKMVIVMATASEKIERRQDTRFRIKDNIFVAIVGRVGSLLDISAHGLSFAVDADEHFATGKTLHLDIFGEDNSFSMKDIPFQVASEVMVNPSSPFTIVIRRRYGVKFGDLSDTQKSQLEYFIQRHKYGTA